MSTQFGNEGDDPAAGLLGLPEHVPPEFVCPVGQHTLLPLTWAHCEESNASSTISNGQSANCSASVRALAHAVAVAVGSVAWPVIIAALALGGYVIGLSNIARKEATRGRVNSWPCWLLLLPLAIPFVLISIPTSPEREAWILLPPLIVFALWVGRSLLFTFKAAIPQHGRTVSGLLAGIVLLDAVVASVPNPGFGPVVIVLFLLALLFQRFIPAT